MLGSKNRRCEDCGRSVKWERLSRVEWTWREPDQSYSQTTFLQLCERCAKRMASAFQGDPRTALTFHPI